MSIPNETETKVMLDNLSNAGDWRILLWICWLHDVIEKEQLPEITLQKSWTLPKLAMY